MKTIIASNCDGIGEQTGSMRPLHKLFSASAIVGLFTLIALLAPLTSLAATNTYLARNAPSFIAKTDAKYGQMIDIAALLHDYDEKLILAVIIVESEGNPVALSNKGAQGLMQLMPPTAKSMGAKDPKEPFQNILAGTKYLKSLEERYGFDSPQEALVAYNMGPSRARRWLSQYSAMDYGYVQKVMYVHGLLVENEKAEQQLARAVGEKLNKAKFTDASSLSQPHALSLATFPISLPLGRRAETTQEK